MKQWMINIISLSLAIIAIIIALIKVTPFEITEGTYVGIIVTLLSIIATFVIGYQIYNSIELKKEITHQKRQYETMLKKNKEYEEKYIKQDYAMKEGFDIMSSIIKYNSGQDFVVCGEAFYYMHKALISSIETDRTDYEWIFDWLRRYISDFNYQTFALGGLYMNDGIWYLQTSKKSLEEVLDIYKSSIREDENKIRSNRNFIKIQVEYNRIIKLLHNRIENIFKDPIQEISKEEREKILNFLY